jgi:hypothetical protein
MSTDVAASRGRHFRSFGRVSPARRGRIAGRYAADPKLFRPGSDACSIELEEACPAAMPLKPQALSRPGI